MLLKNLIRTSSNKTNNVEILDLALDSRKVKKGSLFFALKGSKTDGKKFITQAIEKGAAAIVCSSNVKIRSNKVPIIKVYNVREILSYSCQKFFKYKPKNIIAVTGTNGKSSVADFFRQLLFLNNYSTASIGTLGIIKKNKTIKGSLTSPDIITLHKELSKMKKEKIDNVILEASSHGLDQGRLGGIIFKAGIFTNFSQDHLDYHKTMSKYFNSKMILFSKLLRRKSFIITDEDIKEFNKINRISKKNKIKLITIQKKENKSLADGTKLIGEFQKKNLLMSILAAKLCGLKDYQIKKKICKIKDVNGRIQLSRVLENKSKVFIDYAHTPDALENVLRTLKKNFKKNITLVFGCGGERDKAKRSLMAKVANKYCDKIYVTDDNPRNESPKKIREDLIRHLNKNKSIEIGNRSLAIQTAIKNSDPYEIILLAGKGHEDTQDYGNKVLRTSDLMIVKRTKTKTLGKKKFQLNNIVNKKIINKVLNNKKDFRFTGVEINSKTIKKGNLFVAIKGPKKDGHNYIREAINLGANYCVVSKKINSVNSKKIIKCKNTIKFLNKFALAKRGETSAKIIAITGSAGKTTVKTILGNILNIFAKTYYSPKSFNNHFGVPYSLSNLEADHEYGVFEVGMSKSGEINTLSKIIKPHIALITNIAEAHIENFNNIAGIAKAKGEIINNISENGVVVLNRDCKFFNYFQNLAKNKKIKVISFGKSKNSNVHLISTKDTEGSKILKIRAFNEVILLKLKSVNIYNVLSVIAILKYLGLQIKKIQQYSNFFSSLGGRGKIYEVKRYGKKFHLIDESYNANPLSVKNAINNLSKLKQKGSKKYLLLGDMLELGHKSNHFHKKLSKLINKTDINKLFVYGDKVFETYRYTKKNKRGNILQYKSDFDEIFSKIIKKDDYLMIKGSNSTGLKDISSRIKRNLNNVI